MIRLDDAALLEEVSSETVKEPGDLIGIKIANVNLYVRQSERGQAERIHHQFAGNVRDAKQTDVEKPVSRIGDLRFGGEPASGVSRIEHFHCRHEMDQFDIRVLDRGLQRRGQNPSAHVVIERC